METITARRSASIRRLRPGEPIPTEPPRRYTTSDGYAILRWKVAPYTYVETLEHRVTDGHISTAAHVHHINGDRQDNRSENLEHLTLREHISNRHTIVDFDEAWRLYESGLSTIEVGARLGCDAATISRGLRKYGHTLRDSGTGRRKLLDRERIVSLFLADVSPRRIATIFGISDAPIRRILNEEGIPSRRPGRPVLSASRRADVALSDTGKD